MSAREQYEDFLRWLGAKAREVRRDYQATLAPDGSLEPAVAAETQVKYIALLNRIMADGAWVKRRLRALRNV